jgi:hypothetical protein
MTPKGRRMHGSQLVLRASLERFGDDFRCRPSCRLAHPLSSRGGKPHPARARRLRSCRALWGRRVQEQTGTPQMVSDPRSSAGHGGRNTTALPPTKSSLLNPTANPLAPFMTRLLARTYSLQRAGTRLLRRSTWGHLLAATGIIYMPKPAHSPSASPSSSRLVDRFDLDGDHAAPFGILRARRP